MLWRPPTWWCSKKLPRLWLKPSQREIYALKNLLVPQPPANNTDQFDVANVLAANVRELRAELGWTTRAFSTHSGLSTSSLYEIESSETRTVRLETLERLGRGFGLHPAVLLSLHALPRVHWREGTDFPREMGRVLRRVRAELSLTQTALSERAGVARDIVSKIEVGRRSPTLEVMSRLSNALNLEVRDLLPFENPD